MDNIKYFLDFGNDYDTCYLETCDEHDLIYTGKISDIMKKENNTDWQDALDKFFERELNIKPNEWEVG